MLHSAEWCPRTRHAEPGFEQRLVVRFSVVGDQGVELRQMAGEPVQQACLLAQIAHEKLAQAETLRRDASNADQKRVGPRTTCKSRGLCIKKRPTRAVRPGDRTFRHGVEKVLRKFTECRKIEA